jgi:hypothetical protein
LREASDLLAQLDNAVIPLVVGRVIEAAVARVKTEHDRLIAIKRRALVHAEREHRAVEKRIAREERCAVRANEQAARLREAGTRSNWIRPFYTAWWGAFFTNYDAIAAGATGESEQMKSTIPVLLGAISKANELLRESRSVQADAVELTRQQVHTEQHQQYREMVARLHHEAEERRSVVDDIMRQLATRQEELCRHTHARQHALEMASKTVRGRLVLEAEEAHRSTEKKAAQADSRRVEAQNTVDMSVAAITSLAERIQQTVTVRSDEIRSVLSAKASSLSGLKEEYQQTLNCLAPSLARPPEFLMSDVTEVIARLTEKRILATRRLEFIGQWAEFLSREAENLRDRLASYVNLVCATTVGIATDEYFGDKGAFAEKQFDLLVVDEAGKVTEPEFLVAAARAKRWVLVGDHKQLPPFYDQELDPYLQSADCSVEVASQPRLMKELLTTSIFERLWRQFVEHGSSRLAPNITGGQSDSCLVESDGRGLTPSSVPVGLSEELLTNPSQFPAEKTCQVSADVSATDSGNVTNVAGASRCVMLDVQRRMHPDLALFISDMFYGGQYTSPTEVSFAQGKTLQLEHFPLPVTWIDVNPSITSPGMEIDLSNPTQRSQLAEYAAFLPHNGFANLREAKLVVEVLETLVSDGNLLQERSELETERRSAPVVGVIAFYAGQVALLHRLIEATSSLQAERLSGSEWLCRGIRVTINTVDAFQGKECPIIVLTFVRSNRRKAVGFVDDPNRLNVAISRAQKKLILVGDSMTLAKRSRDREAIGLNKDTRADNLERRMFSQLVKYVEGKGKYMRVFKLRSSSE